MKFEKGQKVQRNLKVFDQDKWTNGVIEDVTPWEKHPTCTIYYIRLETGKLVKEMQQPGENMDGRIRAI